MMDEKGIWPVRLVPISIVTGKFYKVASLCRICGYLSDGGIYIYGYIFVFLCYYFTLIPFEPLHLEIFYAGSRTKLVMSHFRHL